MLCDPLPNFENSPVLAEASVQLRLVMLYVATETDMPVIVELFKEEISPYMDVSSSLDSFKEMLSSFAASSVSQAFVVKFGEHTLFEIEVHAALVHFLSIGSFTPAKGDYYISLLAGDFDRAEFPIYVLGLQLCLDYFWKFPEVQRIVARVSTGAIEERKARLFKEAGLEVPPEITDPSQAELFLLSRVM